MRFGATGSKLTCGGSMIWNLTTPCFSALSDSLAVSRRSTRSLYGERGVALAREAGLRAPGVRIRPPHPAPALRHGVAQAPQVRDASRTLRQVLPQLGN